jgi:hypothetical protein
MGRFLHRVLWNGKLPEAVVGPLLTSFGDRYGPALSSNIWLGGAGATAVAYWHDDSARLVDLVRTGNRHVLEAVLDLETIDDTVMFAICDVWNLSVPDQKRLAARLIEETSPYWMLLDPTLEHGARVAAARKNRRRLAPYSTYDAQAAPAVTVLVAEIRDPTMAGRIPQWGMTVAHTCTWAVEGMIPKLAEALQGETPELTAASWVTFCGMIEGDPDIPVGEVAETAKRLALLETRATLLTP